MTTFRALSLLWVILAFGCGQSADHHQQQQPLFTLLTAEETGVDFINTLDYDEKFNIYTYRNYYNGGGVGLGDFNNDELPDIYMISNTGSNRLFLNKGDLKFEDITEKSGAGGVRSWSTGVSLVDINADGFLDIYVCNSGESEGNDRQNELFINNGDLTFTEQAEAYGIGDRGYTTHASFFDYDRDGDLDLYILNNSFKAIGSFDLTQNARYTRDSIGGDKLLRNDEGHFVDVSAEAGIYGSIIGFGLGVTVGDMNNDGWQDLYISNDFFERDYIYINNGDGTFRETLEQEMRSISGASMGADMADINNDGYMDVFVTEMLPRDESRVKMVTTFEDWDHYQYNLDNGYYHQFTRNMMHLNNGNSTYSEIGRLLGVYATDWSWGALIADFDNDGYKDIYVSNGIYQDLTNQDYLMYIADPKTQMAIISEDNVDYRRLIDAIPSKKISNYAFANKGDLSFIDATAEWGLTEPSHSNGSAYGDLDNDGDLDLVINNVNMPMFIYRNNLNNGSDTANHFLQIDLRGDKQNLLGIGAKIEARTAGATYSIEAQPIRGFESTMNPRPLLGVGENTVIKELKVSWPDGRVTMIKDVPTNQRITIHQSAAGKLLKTDDGPVQPPFIFTDITSLLPIDFKHIENDFVDFTRDRLLFHMRSTEGPKMSKADVNGDGLEDFFVGGAKGMAGELFIQTMEGFVRAQTPVFAQDADAEDLSSLFFDADNDGDMDLYVTSGGNEYPETSRALSDRLYFNDGTGEFVKSSAILPAGRYESTSVVKAADYDNDGDQDLFVGVRLKPFLYGIPANGYILNNDGKGNFTNVTSAIAPELTNFGLITDADWVDIDGDGDQDLIVVGEWLPLSIFINDEGTFQNMTIEAGLANTKGWWNVLAVKDIDGDGDMDFVAGNHGLNSRFKASQEQPVKLYVNDFDQNGSAEHIIIQYNGDKAYPLALRHDVIRQIPDLSEKYMTYENYQGQTIEDMFPPEILERSVVQEVTTLESAIVINNGDGTFVVSPLPLAAQYSPTYAILIDDFDGDGDQDILLGGNLYNVKPEVGRYDASYGTFLSGDGYGDFMSLEAIESGLNLEGEIRDFMKIKTTRGLTILVARNNEKLIILRSEIP